MIPPARTVELLERFCITGGVMELVEWRRRNPWRWVRVLKKWFVEHKKEMAKMLSLMGTAEFRNEGKTLVMKALIQPHTPQEHEMLERMAKEYDDDDISMEQGQLVIKAKFKVPAAAVEQKDPFQTALENAAATAETELESSTPSISASEAPEVLQPGKPWDGNANEIIAAPETAPVEETTEDAASGEGMPE